MYAPPAKGEHVSSGPAIPDLKKLMESWNPGELNAFFCCVRSSEKLEPPSSRAELVAAGINELFWAYNSRTLAETKRTSAQALGTGYNVLPDFLKACITQPPPVGKPYEYSKSLTYEFLLREACGKFDIKDAQRESASLLGIYLFETIIARMLVEMNAKQRHDFLTRRVQLDVMAAGFPTAGWAGPMTTLAALSAAQASGFGVYMGATTALGLASHAVGVTLPFAVYTGMASTIPEWPRQSHFSLARLDSWQLPDGLHMCSLLPNGQESSVACCISSRCARNMRYSTHLLLTR